MPIYLRIQQQLPAPFAHLGVFMPMIANPSKTLIPTGEPGSDLGSLSTLLPAGASEARSPNLGISAQPSKKTADDLQPGTLLLNRYRVVELIARGGYSDIFRAKDEQGAHSLSEDGTSECALKVAQDLYRPEDGASELQHEASMLSRLFHPNIVAFQRWERQSDGREFLVLELLQGASLADVLAEGAQLSIPYAMFIIRAVAAALQYSHDRNIIHGDVTPTNIFLCGVKIPANGGLAQPLRALPTQVKLLDFGSAHHLQESTAAYSTSNRLFLPCVLAYQAPELCGAGRATGDALSDLWALGVLSYRLLAGRLPFDHGNPLHLRLLIRQQDPLPLGKLHRGLPDAVCAAVHWALAKKRDERPSCVRDFVRALDELRLNGNDSASLSTAHRPESSTATSPATPASPPQPNSRATDSAVTPTMVDAADTIELSSREEVRPTPPPPPPAAALQRRRTLSPTAATLALPSYSDAGPLSDSTLPSLPEPGSLRASLPLPGVVSRRNTPPATPIARVDVGSRASSSAPGPTGATAWSHRSAGSTSTAIAAASPSSAGNTFASPSRRGEGGLDTDQQTTLQCHRADLIALTREAPQEAAAVPTNVPVDVAGRHPLATIPPGPMVTRVSPAPLAHSTAHWPCIDSATTNILPGRAWPMPQSPAPATSISWSGSAAQGGHTQDGMTPGDPQVQRAAWVLVGFIGASLFGVILLLASSTRAWLHWLRALLPALALAAFIPATAQSRPLHPPLDSAPDVVDPMLASQHRPTAALARAEVPPAYAETHQSPAELPFSTVRTILPPRAPPMPPPRPIHPDVWLGLGAGGLFGLAGLVTGAVSIAQAHTPQSAPQTAVGSITDAGRRYQDAHSTQIVASLLFAASAVHITVSCAVLLRHIRSSTPPPSMTSSAQPVS